MIHFQCENCGRRFKVPETSAGRTGRCPQCGNKVLVPPASADELTLVHDPDAMAPQEPHAPVATLGFGRTTAAHRAEIAEMRRREKEVLESLGSLPGPEYTGERKVFWLLDVLLYPFNIAGVVTMGVIIGFPLVRALLGAIVPPFVPFRGWAALIAGFIVTLYAVWYLAECVYDSAKGGTRAPDVLDANTSFSALWSSASYLLAVYVAYGLPVVIYAAVMRQADAIFWALAVWGVLLFPMGLLAMVINDSISMLNPLFLLGSILRVWKAYLGLVVCLIGMAIVFVVIPAMLRPEAPPGTIWAFGLLSLIAGTYGSFIFAHVLGRFYWRYRDRLDWGI